MVLLYEVSGVTKFAEPENRMMVARGWGRVENEEFLIQGDRVSVMEHDEVLEMDDTMNVLHATEPYT